MKVTREQILAIMPNAKDKVDAFLPYINGYADTYKITTPKRMAHFLAQIAHESGELRYTKELGNRNYFHKYDVGKLKNMLGNLKDGDGYKYRGRGLIQITGRANYQALQKSKEVTEDIMEHPELLEQPRYATKSAMWWWWKHGLNEKADSDSFTVITKTINGGTYGLESRRNYLKRAKAALKVK
jgi:putative chitinase